MRAAMCPGMQDPLNCCLHLSNHCLEHSWLLEAGHQCVHVRVLTSSRYCAGSAAPLGLSSPGILADGVMAELLLQQNSSRFRFHQSEVRRTRTADLSSMQQIRQLGSHFQLAHYDRPGDQVLQALWASEETFYPECAHLAASAEQNFAWELQLLRLLAAPGMGKVSPLLVRSSGPVCTAFLKFADCISKAAQLTVQNGKL